MTWFGHSVMQQMEYRSKRKPFCNKVRISLRQKKCQEILNNKRTDRKEHSYPIHHHSRHGCQNHGYQKKGVCEV